MGEPVQRHAVDEAEPHHELLPETEVGVEFFHVAGRGPGASIEVVTEARGIRPAQSGNMPRRAGPGASGHVAGLRWTNAPRLGDYLDARAGAPACDVEELDADLRLGEQLMMRLRLIDGVPLNWLAHVLDQPRCETMDRLVDAGLLERTSTHVRLTRRGLLIADSVVGELL